MGDAILCTSALRALRKRFEGQRIYFLANGTVRRLLSPSPFADEWIDTSLTNLFSLVRVLRQHRIFRAVLFKNSFKSALITFLAGVPERIGYARDGRSIFLTEKIPPLKDSDGRFKPASMIDYYMTIADRFGCDTTDTRTELPLQAKDKTTLANKLPDVLAPTGPLIILVPGGTFGPSKRWPEARFAETADWLTEKYNANIVVSVAPNRIEAKTAERICSLAKANLHNLAETPLTMGQLKALFAAADLVITNDTGPRHIAIALGRKVITLFGPNNPSWTDTGYQNETKIVGRAPCAPCDKPQCRQKHHLCMEAITVEMVCDAVAKMLGKQQEQVLR
jgi:heptosyltransferase-2